MPEFVPEKPEPLRNHRKTIEKGMDGNCIVNG
jgi:hypothetical protein